MNTAQQKAIPIISDKPYPILIEMRPLWRISLIVLSIVVVSGSKKYLDANKVNILVWMLIRNKRWDEYEDYLLGRTVNIPLVSVDTATYKAVELTLAKELTELRYGRLYISEKGEHLFSIIMNNDLLKGEINFLERVGKKLSANKVKGLTGKLL